MDRNLSILQWNSRSINANKGSFEVALSDLKVDVATVNETWLKPNFNFTIANYFPVRADRLDGKGGVMILIKNNINYQVIPLVSPSFHIQICGVRIKLSESFHLSIVTCYCSPRSYLTNNEWLLVLQSVPTPFLFLGDFNAHSQLWGCHFQDVQGDNLASLIDDLNLTILNDGTETRLTHGNNYPSIVDLSLVSASLSSHFNYEVLEDSLGSDHFPILITHNSPGGNTPQNFNPRFKTENADWMLFGQIIQNKFNSAPVQLSSLSRYKFLESSIIEAANVSIPQTKLSTKSSPKCWWNLECQEIIQQRKKAHKKYKLNPILNNFIELKRLQAKAKYIIKTAKRESWNKFCSSINPNTSPKDIWNKIKRISGSVIRNKSPISPEVINNFLDKLAPPNVSQLPIIQTPLNNSPDVLADPFSFNELVRALISSKDSSPGLDRITYSMIKNIPIIAQEFLLDIYNDLRHNQEIPPSWKIQIILPILKPGKSPEYANSLRPIALSSCLLKIFEKMIKFRLESFLESNYKIHMFSFGFRSNASTMDNLSILINNILEGFVYKKITPALFIDIEGAYDNVNLHKLYQKLVELGVGSSTSSLIFNLLFERTIQVKSSTHTFSRLLTKGVPQGSVLSPLLFICYTYDIFDAVSGEFKLLQFADDFVIYHSSPDITHTIDVLSSALFLLINYLNNNNLRISASKSALCIFSRKRSSLPILVNLSGYEFEVKSIIKYLGIILDFKLRWSPHINYLIGKCSPFLNLLRVLSNSKWGGHPQSLLTIYKALIRSRLEYGNYLFGNASYTKLQLLDRIQYSALRICLGYLRSSPTNAILIEANDPPLSLRREFMAAKFFIKRKSKFFHPSIEAINSLEFACLETPYYNNSKIPWLVQVSLKFNNLNIPLKKFSVNPIHLIDLDILNTPLYIRLSEPHIGPNENYENIIYTDGSKSTSGVGCAFINTSNNFFHLFKLHSACSVFTAELVAIREALNYTKINNHKSTIIISDSKATLSAIQSSKYNRKINLILFQIISVIKYLHLQHHSIRFSWIKGHSGNIHNNLVDYLAKRAVSAGVPLVEGLSTQDAIIIFNQGLYRSWKAIWRETSRYKGLSLYKLKPSPGPPWFIYNPSSPRKEITLLNRIRINHTLTNSHLYRLSLSPTPFCTCSPIPATPEHLILQCPLYTIRRRELLKEILPHFRDPPTFRTLIDCPSENLLRALVGFISSCNIYF